MTPPASRPLTRLIALVAGVILGVASHAWAQGLPPAPHAAAPPKITQMPSSTSSSGQFVVHGSDLGTRGAFCLLCDDTAAALGRLLHDNARYTLPVVVVLKGPPDVDRTGPAITTNISQLAHGGFHLQINVQLRADFQSEEFARELVRVLLAERILRNHAELTTKRDRVLPDWVLTGVTQALEFRARSRPSALFAAVFRGGQVFSVDKILAADPAQLDALSRTIYETSSCAIVLALLEQDQGPVRFGRFLNALALDNKSDRDLLKQFFPTLGASKNSLEKWWTLQMATLATPSALESLSISETEQKLDEALTLRYEPLPEKEKKGKEHGKTSQAEPAPGAAFPFAHFVDLDNSALFFNLACLWKSYVSGMEVAATTAKDSDADDNSGKKQQKKKDSSKDKGSDKDKDKKAASKKEPEKKEPEKKVASKKVDDKKEPDKKAAKKKEEEDKKEAEKKLAAQKEADKNEAGKKAAAAKKKEAEEKKEPEKKIASKKESGKKEEEDKTSGLNARPHRVAQLPPGISAPSPEENKKEEKGKESKSESEEKPSGEKHSRWNPVHWFHGSSEKPAPETEAKTTPPAKHSHPASKPEPKPEAIASNKKSQGTIQDYLQIWKRPDRSNILQRNLELLNALKNQAHPLYRPLIAQYAEIVRNLVSGKDRGAKEKLENLHDQYVKISNESKAVESYLDWYEASETPNYSGTFDDYLKLRDKLDKAIRPRGDAISQYLDSLEKEYEN